MALDLFQTADGPTACPQPKASDMYIRLSTISVGVLSNLGSLLSTGVVP